MFVGISERLGKNLVADKSHLDWWSGRVTHLIIRRSIKKKPSSLIGGGVHWCATFSASLDSVPGKFVIDSLVCCIDYHNCSVSEIKRRRSELNTRKKSGGARDRPHSFTSSRSGPWHSKQSSGPWAHHRPVRRRLPLFAGLFFWRNIVLVVEQSLLGCAKDVWGVLRNYCCQEPGEFIAIWCPIDQCNIWTVPPKTDTKIFPGTPT